MKQDKQSTLTIRLPQDVKDKLDKDAHHNYRKMSDHLRFIIEKHLREEFTTNNTI